MKTPTCFLCALLCVGIVLVQAYTPPHYCKHQPKEGQCGHERPTRERWYFDERYGYCGPFLWGGCSEDMNNFPNCTSCMTTCSTHLDPEGACRNIINSA
ncbi:hypothetical protein V5799_007218 [Amblyomma americanum]|uniref:BPTI/Kunitz inhibitor domain-containing protein n=1 Tax=Amblyomma americanum TaxID=6943 RepID=A0AAQ4DU63_AMBAM